MRPRAATRREPGRDASPVDEPPAQQWSHEAVGRTGDAGQRGPPTRRRRPTVRIYSAGTSRTGPTMRSPRVRSTTASPWRRLDGVGHVPQPARAVRLLDARGVEAGQQRRRGPRSPRRRTRCRGRPDRWPCATPPSPRSRPARPLGCRASARWRPARRGGRRGRRHGSVGWGRRAGVVGAGPGRERCGCHAVETAASTLRVTLVPVPCSSRYVGP